MCRTLKFLAIFAPTLLDGDIAQLVEQWTENPCVGGSNPSITTKENRTQSCLVFY